MSERRRHLVLAGFVPRLAEHAWIQPGHSYEGLPASDVLPDSVVPWVRLIHPTEPGVTALLRSSANGPGI